MSGITIFFLIIYLLCFVFIIAYTIVQFSVFISFLRSSEHRENQDTSSPIVTIQLPVYNEKYVIQRLLEAVSQIRYPSEKLQIQVIDDSTDETVQIIDESVSRLRSEGIPIEIFRREIRSGFKAGALRDAMPEVRGEFIAIFDADFLPLPDFLEKSIPHFANNPNIGVVQTRWEHINENSSLLTKMQAFHLNVHFIVEQTGRNEKDVFIQFNGTAGIWRKKCIEDAGGWSSDTLTEDLDLSYRAQMRGWKIRYLPQIGSPAELPADMHSFKSQQFRWMKGGAETARKILPQLFSTSLSSRIKVHGLMHLLNSSIFLATLIAALCSVGLYFTMDLSLFHHLIFAFPIAYVMLVFIYYHANHSSILKESIPSPQLSGIPSFIVKFPLFLILSMGMSLHNSRAVVLGFMGKSTDFIRTPKFNITGTQYASSEKKDSYVIEQFPTLAMIEIAFGVGFGILATMGILYAKYEFIIFHYMLAFGFLGIGIYTLIDRLRR